MAGKEKCGRCGKMVTHLHSGGDARIEEPGVCSSCHYVLASVAARVAAQAQEAEIKKLTSDALASAKGA